VVENLTKNVTKAHLHEIFGVYGDIIDLDLPINKTCASPLPTRLLPSLVHTRPHKH
jgi:hypothetical protein